MTDTIEAVARAICEHVFGSPKSWKDFLPESRVMIAAHTKALIEGAGELERADRIARHMNAIAMASQRVDGTDIPLGEQCREAARMVMDQAATISALLAENARLEPYVEAFRREERRADDLAQKLDDAKLEGVRAGIEAAAERLRTSVLYTSTETRGAFLTARDIIRALDPAAIVEGME